ncbi:MAG: hypothetical protein PHR13_12105 [Dysgonamonadaceae bacterium]|nr:hypothetical protein [Dysgonamonadaceae bacterium]
MIKDYIITYRSLEHYEVLGWVRAESMEEAKKEAKNFSEQIKKYGVKNMMIAEWNNGESISLN